MWPLVLSLIQSLNQSHPFIFNICLLVSASWLLYGCGKILYLMIPKRPEISLRIPYLPISHTIENPLYEPFFKNRTLGNVKQLQKENKELQELFDSTRDQLEFLKKGIDSLNKLVEHQLIIIKSLNYQTSRIRRLIHPDDQNGFETKTCLFYNYVNHAIIEITKGSRKRSSLMLIDKSDKRLKIVAGSGLSDQTTIDRSFGRGEGIAGHVLKTGEPEIVKNVQRSQKYVKFGSSGEYKSLLVVPIKVGDETEGVLCLDSPEENVFDDDDAFYVSLFANQVSIVASYLELVERYPDLIRCVAPSVEGGGNDEKGV